MQINTTLVETLRAPCLAGGNYGRYAYRLYGCTFSGMEQKEYVFFEAAASELQVEIGMSMRMRLMADGAPRSDQRLLFALPIFSSPCNQLGWLCDSRGSSLTNPTHVLKGDSICRTPSGICTGGDCSGNGRQQH